MKKKKPGGLMVPGLLMLFFGLFAVIMGIGLTRFFGGVAIAIVIFGLIAIATGVILVVLFYKTAAAERRNAPKAAPYDPADPPVKPADGQAAQVEDPFTTEHKAVITRKIKPWEYPPAPKYCPWCGTGMFSDYMYCPKCGKEL